MRSVRRGARVVQEVVANLGHLDAAEVREAAAVARHFLGPKGEPTSLLRGHHELGPENVHVSKVRIERGRAFGDVWLGWVRWQALELDESCCSRLPHSRESVPWPEKASILAIARLCEPSSELHIAEDWYRKTALSDRLGVAAEKMHHTRLYQGLDCLLKHKVELHRHIKERMGLLLSLKYDLMLYDVTSTCFEGECTSNTLAKCGCSRGDCKQVCIGSAVSREGNPLGDEVFDGNRVDVTTVETIVEEMERRYGKAGRVWVMIEAWSAKRTSSFYAKVTDATWWAHRERR